tara:strand:+ start:242 stop:769 length:528 start_codon:yes stop_codon:yes gene_type:complete
MKKLKNKDLQRINIEEFKITKKIPVTIILDNVRSALNVGSVFRTSDAFLIETIILCGITATPPNREIRKAALGASESVNWKYIKKTTDAVKQLIRDGYYVVSLEQTEKSTLLNKFKLPKKPIAIIMGNEVNGVEQKVIDLCNEVIEIPQFGTKHSLNIAVTTAIVLWDFWKKINP